MNIYVIVEGEFATKKIYQNWIPLVNKQLHSIDYLHDFTQDNFFIFCGKGQPSYWTMVDKAIEDVNNIKSIDRLVIAIDSEDKEYDDMLSEAKQRVQNNKCRVEVRYIIQHFCLETWLLGNNNIFHENTRNIILQDYYSRFDIRNNDPELLPAHPPKFINRAKFAFQYLREGIKDAHGNKKHYTKHSPGIALEETFFNRIKYRCERKQHIQSFNAFLAAFV